jgi:hypothetical protein
MNPTEESIVREFTGRIEAWRPDKPGSGTGWIFSKDRAELSKIRTAFKRGKYAAVIDMTDCLDTIVRDRVPRAVLQYSQLKLEHAK